MVFRVTKQNPVKTQSECMVIPFFSATQLKQELSPWQDKIGSDLKLLLAKKHLSNLPDHITWLYPQQGSGVESILIVGGGKRNQFNAEALSRWLKQALMALKEKNLHEATFLYDPFHAIGIDGHQFGKGLAQQVHAVQYAFTQFKSKPKQCKALVNIQMISANTHAIQSLQQGFEEGDVIGRAIRMTKDVANMPPNICNPSYLAECAQKIAQQFSTIEVEVLDETELKRLGMNSYLAVGQGSENEAKLTILHYKGAADASSQPIVLIGKGITFDAGGISLKPAVAMDEMKYDMCGAAAVLGTIQAAAELQLPLNIVGLLAGSENLPSGSAYRPGDILTTHSGQTVEVLNTDAEGRLVLCDALSYASRFKPKYVIDLATLTGACIIALGHEYNALLSNDADLTSQLLNAAEKGGDKTWQLPLDEAFQTELDSPFADMANVGGRAAGTITAACFLSRFTQDYSWAHLDIAGTAWKSGRHKNATGRPVNLLVQFLLDQVNAG